MKMVKILTFTMVVGLLAFTYANSSALPGQSGELSGPQTQGHDQQMSQIQQGAPNTTKDSKDAQGQKANGRMLGGVGGYEQIGYAPQPIAYEAPVQYAPVSSYSAPSYSAPSYSAPSYSAPSYSAPSYSAPSYSAPSYSAPSYAAPAVYEQPIVQTYQQPIYQNYSTQSYSAPAYQAPAYTPAVTTYSTPSYSTPSYSTPSYSNYSTPSYSAPVYSPPVTTYSTPSYSTPSYSTPSYSTPSYSTPSYSTPSYSNYSTPSYSAPAYQAPVYTPAVTTYSTPSYSTPSYSNYSTPSYSAPVYSPPVTTYSTQSYSTPSYSAPSYSAPSYSAPSYSNYSVPAYQPPVYSPPVETYSAPSYGVQTSYAAPVVQSYGSSYSAPSYGVQSSYAAPVVPSYQGTVYKRQLNNSTTFTNATASGFVADADGAADDDMTGSDSVVIPSYLPATQYKTVGTPLVTGYQNQILQQYLDTQPEFTQSWTDFPYVPGYLPAIFRNFLTPYQQQQQYKVSPSYTAGAIPQNIGFGYSQWNGPINPSSFYVPVRLPYYYRIPPLSPFYKPGQALYQTQTKVYKTPLVITPVYKAGYAKRSMGSHEAAPYQLLVDHLAAAASENKDIFTNVSTIECPAKPSDYTCPQMLNLNKEELKKKLCDYETVLSASINLIPDTEKAQTRCGALKINKQNVKNDDDMTDLPERMAIVLSKDCKLNSIFSNDKSTNDQVFMFVKTAIPSGTKFILADGSNIDLMSSQIINNEELSTLMKQCPKKSQ